MLPALLLALTSTATPGIPTSAEVERLERMLGALAAYENDQRQVGALMAIGAGVGIASAGVLLAADSSIPDSNKIGPIFIGAGAATGVLGLLLALSTGDAQDIADTFSGAAITEPRARLRAVRAAEASLVELDDEYETARTWISILFTVSGVATAGFGVAVLGESGQDSLRVSAAVAMGTGLGIAGVGVYLLAFGKSPVERFIDGYTPITVAPTVGVTAEGDPTVGLGGRF